MKYTTISLLIVLLSFTALGQDKILLTNGKVLRGKVTSDSDGLIKFKYFKKGGSEKNIEISKYRVFSITDIDGEESILYKKDSLLGSFLTVNEMRMYIYGQRDAYDNYRPGPFLVGSIAAGFSTVLLDTYEFNGPSTGFFKRSPSVVSFVVPIVLPITAGIFNTRIRREHASDVTFLSNDYYIEGFQKVAKSKRLFRTFIGSAVGVGLGFLTYGLSK